MKLKLDTIEPKLRERIERQMRQEDALRRNDPRSYPVDSDKIELSNPEPKPKRIRQDSKPLMNKLETEFYWKLKAKWSGRQANIRPQTLRFKLGNGIWYKPDFTFICSDVAEMPMAWEVKGPHAFRGGLENLKVAASLYPEWQWILVWKSEAGEWQQQMILP